MLLCPGGGTIEGERQGRDDGGVCIDLVVPFEGSAVSEF